MEYNFSVGNNDYILKYFEENSVLTFEVLNFDGTLTGFHTSTYNKVSGERTTRENGLQPISDESIINLVIENFKNFLKTQ